MYLFIFQALCFAVSTAKAAWPYPCDSVRCHSKLPFCRIQRVDCFTSPCYPVAVCTNSPPPVPSVCSVGGPVINANMNQIKCSSDANCPDGTYCTGGSCCWTNPEKPGSCPRQKRSYRKIRVKRCGRPCSIDSDCSGNQKCCLSGGCGHICRSPVIEQNDFF
ncbi:hypothetical protein SNE40_019641 [Patella caerulea]|uniref:WAP domain-containing protein n=1 Tax=Patella caerulea TaxID=87958 RepID=A0AAN8J7E2_PATCE